MPLTLYSHPFSSYCQKVLIALWENATPFTYRNLEESAAAEECAVLWPLGRFPVLTDGDRTIMESSIIIEHLDVHHPGPIPLLPTDRAAALDVRFMDRFFDNYIMAPVQKLISESLRPDGTRSTAALAEAGRSLETAYAWVEQRLSGRAWAAAECFTMADCAAAPSLFYADWIHRIGPAYPHLLAYRARLRARPSFSRAVEEARPYRSVFPLGAPDRD